MDKFVDFMGVEQDLDDLSLYPEEWLKLTAYDLWLLAEKKAGASLFYMQFLHPPEEMWGDQVGRIHAMCRELVDMRIRCLQGTRQDHARLIKWLFKFEDEVENQC